MAVNAGMVPWRVKRKLGPDEFEVIDKGPGVDLLKRPNPYCTGTELKEAMTGWLLGDGNYYLELVRNPVGRVVEVYVLDARRVKVVPDREDFIKGYLLEVPNTAERVRFEPHEIVHGKLFNLLSPWYGMTPFAALRRVVQANVSADEWNEVFFNNSAIPAGVLQSKEEHLPDEEVQRLRTYWEQAHRGVRKAWRTAITWGGLEYKAISPTHKEMGFAELDDRTRDKILGVLGVPRPHYDNLTYATSYIQDRDFWTKTIQPLLNRVGMTLNAQFLPHFADAHGLNFDEDPEAAMVSWDYSAVGAMSDLLGEQEEAYNTAIGNGSMLINEARKLRGQDPVPWGDTWHGPLTIIALAELQKSAHGAGILRRLVREERVPVELVGDLELLGATGVDTGMGFDGALALVSAFTRPSNNGRKSLPALLQEGAAGGNGASRGEVSCGSPSPLPPAADKMIPSLGSKERRKIIWKRFETQLRPTAKGLERIVRRALNAQRDRVNSRLKEWESSRKQDDVTVTSNLTVEFLFDTEEEAKALMKALDPHITEVASEFGQSALDQLGIEQEYDPTSETLREFINRRLALMSQRTADSMFEDLAKLLHEAQTGDSTVQELARELREYYDVQSKVRAMRIARTEAGSAANFAIVDGWRQSSVVVGKEWISSRDGKVRDTHAGADGQVVRLGEQFKLGSVTCDHPMDPTLPASEQVNCRCTSAPVLDEEALSERGGARDPLFLVKDDVPLLKAA